MSDAANLQLAQSIMAQFGHPLVSYISGFEVGPDLQTGPLPPSVNLAIDKLHELRVAIASTGQPISHAVSRLALQGHLDSMRQEIGNELPELVSSDPLVQSLGVILRGLSTLMMTAPYLYAYEPFSNAVYDIAIWNPRLESDFRMRVAGDDALRNLLPKEEAAESPDADTAKFTSEFRANSFLNSLLRSCYLTGRLRGQTSIQQLGEVALELLQSARQAGKIGVATVSYFSVINGIALEHAFHWKSVHFYPMGDACHDILDREARPSISSPDQVMGFVLEIRHRRRYVETVDLATGAHGYNASPDAPAELEKQMRAVPLAIALATQLAGRMVWTSVADAHMGLLPWSFRSDPHALRAGVVEASKEPQIVDWLELLNRLKRNNLRIAERRLMSMLSERPQPADRLIDAVIVWEALFGGDSEMTFRISTGIAFLVGETPAEIDDIRRKCTNLYNLRSKLVHGSIDVDDPRVTESANQASDLALRAMEALYRDAPDLLGYRSTERTTMAVLRRMNSPATDAALDGLPGNSV